MEFLTADVGEELALEQMKNVLARPAVRLLFVVPATGDLRARHTDLAVEVGSEQLVHQSLAPFRRQLEPCAVAPSDEHLSRSGRALEKILELDAEGVRELDERDQRGVAAAAFDLADEADRNTSASGERLEREAAPPRRAQHLAERDDVLARDQLGAVRLRLVGLSGCDARIVRDVMLK
jgi:hypothetical protein